MSLKETALNAYIKQTGEVLTDIISELYLDDMYIFKTMSTKYSFKEIFIYSQDFEAIHIRAEDIARGGIRISDRSDYRNEALDLVLAQIPKNSMVIPSGAKGCIYIKGDISAEDAYKKFVRAIIRITKDSEDNYLVIAADRGTSTYADLANKISIEENFWLKDAFASGGSTGYDHKKIGITSAGVWQTILIRLDMLNKLNTFISMIGVGSMNGDVFGNALSQVGYGQTIKLLAAISSKEIFIDPDPDVVESLNERRRLFGLSDSSWGNYDRAKLSKGGMIISRKDLQVTVTDQVKQMLNLTSHVISTNILIKELLKHSVDILFMGAVGTYVQASDENINFDIANKDIRVNANELNCKLFAEGANLSITHAGRLEASRKNILVYTDFIDNLAGVFCSDIEINLKILLNNVSNRDYIISNMKNYYTMFIVNNCYDQVFALQTASRLTNWHKVYTRLKNEMSLNQFSFTADLLPDIAFLMSYLKIYLKKKLMKTNLDNYKFYLYEYFSFVSMASVDTFEYKQHLISTLLSSEIVNYLFLRSQSVDDIIDKVFNNYIYNIRFKVHSLLDRNFSLIIDFHS